MKPEKLININWYLERKPYSTYTSYDLYYLKICRELFTLINQLATKYQDSVDLEAEDCRELAYNFTAYFEDQVNSIGFWQALIHLHHKEFGKRIPFYDPETLRLQEEEYEDILPADVHYLAFISYLNLMTWEDEKTMTSFENPFLVEMAKQVFDYLDAQEEVLTTDSYADLLLPPDDYIDFKKLLDWFTYESYLTGFEFSRKHSELLLEHSASEPDLSLLGPLMYEERDRLMFTEPSTLTAFFPLDLLADAMQCPEGKKEEIRNLKWRPYGLFKVDRESTAHYHFVHTATGETFDVLKNSLNHAMDFHQQKYWLTTLAHWNDNYYISGMCLGCLYNEKEIKEQNLKNQHSFQKHFKAYRDQLHEVALEYRQKTAEFFGRDLIEFDSVTALQEQLDAFATWHFHTATGKSKGKGPSKPALFQLPQEVLHETDLALFIPPADGLQFVFQHKKLLHVLQAEADKVSWQEIEDVLPLLLAPDAEVDYWKYLKSNYTLPNLSLFLKCPVEKEEDFDACLRIYRPEAYSPLKLPSLTLVDSTRMSLKTIKTLFSKK